MDGTPTSRLNDWLLRSVHAKKIDMGSTTPTPEEQLPKPAAITFKLDSAAQKAIQTAIKNHDEELSKHKISVLQYNGYGKDLYVSTCDVACGQC